MAMMEITVRSSIRVKPEWRGRGTGERIFIKFGGGGYNSVDIAGNRPDDKAKR
jgi:hypothetical protein